MPCRSHGGIATGADTTTGGNSGSTGIRDLQRTTTTPKGVVDRIDVLLGSRRPDEIRIRLRSDGEVLATRTRRARIPLDLAGPPRRAQTHAAAQILNDLTIVVNDESHPSIIGLLVIELIRVDDDRLRFADHGKIIEILTRILGATEDRQATEQEKRPLHEPTSKLFAS